MVERKQMHLKDLFATGREVVFDFEWEGEDVEIRIWMRKPTTSQQEEALAKARSKQARRKKKLQDHDSDEYVALVGDLEIYETREDVIDQLLHFEKTRLQTQAFNDILHNEEFMPRDENGKPLYGDENVSYLALLTAIEQRMEEIRQFNSDLQEGDESLFKKFDDDEELQLLRADRDEFERYVEERAKDLEAIEKRKWDGKKIGDLRKLLAKKLIETDAGMAWYQEYRSWMLFFSCRDPDDKSKAYFSSPEEIVELPVTVLSHLEGQLDDMNMPGDSLKNLPSPRNSSDS